MQVLEIVRLELLHFGIGLLPFTIVGLIMGALLHWSEGARGRIRGWQTINAVVWIGGVVMSAVQVVGLIKEGINGRKKSKYPISDQVIDVAVMAECEGEEWNESGYGDFGVCGQVSAYCKIREGLIYIPSAMEIDFILKGFSWARE
jgi:hypothetical protein